MYIILRLINGFLVLPKAQVLTCDSLSTNSASTEEAQSRNKCATTSSHLRDSQVKLSRISALADNLICSLGSKETDRSTLE